MTRFIVKQPIAAVEEAMRYAIPKGHFVARAVTNTQTSIEAQYADDIFAVAFVVGVLHLDRVNIANHYYKPEALFSNDNPPSTDEQQMESKG